MAVVSLRKVKRGKEAVSQYHYRGTTLIPFPPHLNAHCSCKQKNQKTKTYVYAAENNQNTEIFLVPG